MVSAAHYLSKNVYFNICHGKNSKVTAVDKFQKFGVDTPLKIAKFESTVKVHYSLWKQHPVVTV